MSTDSQFAHVAAGDAASARVGEALSGVQVGAIVLVAVAGALVPALQPLLLGGLEAEHRLTAAQLGQAATFELLGMALSTSFAAAWLPPRHLRSIGAAVGLILLAINLATIWLNGAAVIGARFIAGAACGIFLWMLVNLLTRARSPAHWTGIYLVAQGLSALALSALYSAVIIPRFGVNGGFACAALVGAVTALASPFLPARFAPLPTAVRTTRMPPLGGCAALASSFLYMAAILSIWIYVPAFAHNAGYSPSTIAFAISAAIGMQIAGGGAAIVLAKRAVPVAVLGFGGAAGAMIALVLAAAPAQSLFVAAIALFGALWMFVIPFQIPFIIEADSTRRSAMLAGGAQLFGYAAGPAVASTLVRGTDVRGAILAGSALFLVSGALAFAAYRARDRRPESVVGVSVR